MSLPPVPKSSTGQATRERLLLTALRLFSAKGYARTSIREIANAAHVNISAISYYFTDKEGLYRAVFAEPLCKPANEIADEAEAATDLRSALKVVIDSFFDPLKEGELMAMMNALHMREILEPVGVRAEDIEQRVKPATMRLAAMLAGALGLAEPDDDVYRLAFSILGLGLQMYFMRDVVEATRPALLDTRDAIETWSLRMVDYAEAMIAKEHARRQQVADIPNPLS